MIVAETRCIDDILAAATPALRLDAVARAGLDDESGIDWLVEQLGPLAHADPERALALGEVTLDAARRLRSDAAEAGVHYTLARVHAERGDFDRAVLLIERAHDAWSAAGEDLQALRTNLGRMAVLDDLGRHAEATEVGQSILQRLVRLPDPVDEAETVLRRTVEAAAWGNLGVCAGFLGEHEESLAAYQRSEVLYAGVGLDLNVAEQRANRGIELVALGRAREAVGVLAAARQAFAADGDVLGAAKCGGHLAEALLQAGRVVDAIGRLQESLTQLAGLGYAPEESRLQVQLAQAYLDAGLHAEARASATRAVHSAEEAGMVHDRAFARLALSLALLGDGQPEPAAAVLAEAAEDFATAGDRQYLARAGLIAGRILLRQGRSAAAGKRLVEAERLTRAGGWTVPLAWTLVALAEAAEAAETAEPTAVDPSGVETPLAEAETLNEQLALPDLTLRTRLLRARLLRRQGRVTDAERLLVEALVALDRIGTTLPGHLLQLAHHADRQAPYDELVDLLVERGGPGDAAAALAVSDRAKAATLTGLVGGARPRVRRPGSGPAGLTELEADLAATFAALQEADDPARLGVLHARARELETAISGLRVRLSAGAGSPVAAAPAAPREPERAEVVLAYHVLGDRVVAFVGRRQVHAVDLGPVRPAVEHALDQLVSQWSRFAMGRAFVERHAAALTGTTRRVLAELHDLLVAPVRRHLDREGQGGVPLLVSPHRSLHRVPFHALYDGTTYLLQERAVRVAATSRAAEAPVRRPGTLVLATPDARAPQIEREAELLGAGRPDVRVLVGEPATTAELARSLPGPGVLHLACHGLYRAANPLFSAIRLSDRWLTAAEVLDLDLRGVLVVLSACESGRRSEDTAEAVGLAWSFLGAGATQVVVSQWVVDDRATVDLMAHLHREVALGSAPADALRAAQLAVLETHPHPYHWAPFICVLPPAPGDPPCPDPLSPG